MSDQKLTGYRHQPYEMNQNEIPFLSLFFKSWKSGLILFLFLISLTYPFLNWREDITLGELINGVGSNGSGLLWIIGIELLLTGIFLFAIYRIKKRIIKNENKFKGIISFNIILFLALFSALALFIVPLTIVPIPGAFFSPLPALFYGIFSAAVIVLFLSVIPSILYAKFCQNKTFIYVIFGVFILLTFSLALLSMWGINNCDFYADSFCVGQKALKTHNIFLCEKANRGPSDKLWCYRGVKEEFEKLKDKNLCQKLKGIGTTEDEILGTCINYVVRNTNNPLLCEELDSSTVRNECYVFASLNENQDDITTCDKISRGEIEDTRWSTEALYTLCVLNIAIGTENFNFCNKIQDLKSKNRCFYEIAKQTNDPVLCEKITHSNVYNDCYANIAKNVNNPSLCEKIIPFKNDKDHCYNQFNNEKIKSEHE